MFQRQLNKIDDGDINKTKITNGIRRRVHVELFGLSEGFNGAALADIRAGERAAGGRGGCCCTTGSIDGAAGRSAQGLFTGHKQRSAMHSGYR